VCYQVRRKDKYAKKEICVVKEEGTGKSIKHWECKYLTPLSMYKNLSVVTQNEIHQRGIIVGKANR